MIRLSQILFLLGILNLEDLRGLSQQWFRIPASFAFISPIPKSSFARVGISWSFGTFDCEAA